MKSSNSIIFFIGVHHYNDVIMGAIASRITSLTIIYSTVYSDADQRKHQSSASLAFVRGIHRGPVNSPQKWPVTRKIFPFDDVIMITCICMRGCLYFEKSCYFWHFHTLMPRLYLISRFVAASQTDDPSDCHFELTLCIFMFTSMHYLHVFIQLHYLTIH